MANKTKQILIESILGGHSTASHFASKDQFMASTNIDPSYPVSNSTATPVNSFVNISGLLRPIAIQAISGGTAGGGAMWIKTNPKETNIYIYDYNGSVYTTTTDYLSVTALSDTGEMTSAKGNGSEYYDNYIYFSKNTDIARYGPLNGTPTFNGTYWTGTLGKVALIDTTYPTNGFTRNMPNHVMCRHSDGKLYIADVVDNQGTLHKISTTKTSVEGDTDAGSTYNVLQFGYGLWPTAIESYGSSIVTALFEGVAPGVGVAGSRNKTAKIAFWDTTSQRFNTMIWSEFPDNIIFALKNINGTLYIFSGNYSRNGVRVTRYIGGYSVEEVAYIPNGAAPYAGGVDGSAQRLIYGSNINLFGTSLWPCVFSIGLQKSDLTNGIFCTMASTSTTSGFTSALALVKNSLLSDYSPIFGTTNNKVEAIGTDYSLSQPNWFSQIYKIGNKFKITKITLPLSQTVSSGISFIPTIYFDDGVTSSTLATVDNTSYPGKQSIIIRPTSATGNHNFFLRINWTGASLCVIGLPITIEYELIDE